MLAFHLEQPSHKALGLFLLYLASIFILFESVLDFSGKTWGNWRNGHPFFITEFLHSLTIDLFIIEEMKFIAFLKIPLALD